MATGDVIQPGPGPDTQSIDINQVETQLKQLKWPADHKYGGECCCKDYIKGEVPLKYIQPQKPKSYKPSSMYVPPTENFPTDTVYKRSYEPIDCETRRNCRPKGGPPRSNLTNCGPFSPNTTHRMSYGPIPCPERSERYYPHEHNLKGRGPMQDLTTHQHDYTPKPIQPPRPYKYLENIGLPETPMEHRTTHRLSYTPVDLKCIDPPHSYRPTQVLEPCEPFPKETVYRTSYLPNKPGPRIPKCTPGYVKPCIPMSGRTIYTGSFVPPGQFVKAECPPGEYDKGCYCVYPGECLVEAYKKAHDYTVPDDAKSMAGDIKHVDGDK
ncbi:hypothetical protein M8J76_013546 [Diaphorina citri]|nr:hypothetical protein M8J75_008143 [Diaphorina citri]KAI5730427.1 hypothetical protein M8J76_013546 [Diaphorina citri]